MGRNVDICYTCTCAKTEDVILECYHSFCFGCASYMKRKTEFNKEDITALDKKPFNIVTLECSLCLGQFKISTLIKSVENINLVCGCKLESYTKIENVLYNKIIAENYTSIHFTKE